MELGTVVDDGGSGGVGVLGVGSALLKLQPYLHSIGEAVQCSVEGIAVSILIGIAHIAPRIV